MIRRSVAVLAKQTGRRTIVRDPRKKSRALEVREKPPEENHVSVTNQSPRVMPFEPSEQNQQSVGSTLGSYALAGVGVTLGVVLVRVVLGF